MNQADTKDRQGRKPLTWEQTQLELDLEVKARIWAREKGEGRSPCTPSRIRKRPWLPWLFIRGTAADTGARPVVWPPTPYWESPDIVVDSGDPQGRPIAGKPNFVLARIWNLGRAAAAPTKVDFGWANPALGLGPGHVFPISGNKPEYVLVPPLSAVWVKCQTPWVPVLVNGGHECLFVDCDNHILDPLRHPWEPQIDRHAGQRNVTVISAPPGGLVNFGLEFNNIFPHATMATIAFRAEHLALTTVPRGLFEFNEVLGAMVAHTIPAMPVRASAARRAALRARRPLSVERGAAGKAVAPIAVREILEGRGAPSLRSVIEERSATVPYANADAYVARLFQARAARSGERAVPVTRLHELQMKAFEQRHLQLQLGVPPGARPGEFVVFHLVQENEGFPLGGYAVVVEVVGAAKQTGKEHQ